MSCTDDLIHDHKISDEHMTLMKQFYDEDQAVQYLMIVGHYVMAAGLVNSAGVTMEDNIWLQPSK